MLDSLLSFVIAESTLVSAIVAGALVCVGLGWLFKGSGANRREAALKQAVLDAKGSIPHFETSVRTREQQIDRLQLEMDPLKERIDALDRSVAQKDIELRAKAREIRVLTTELSAAKSVQGTDTMLLDGMDFDSTDTLDTETQARVEKAEALYEKLRETLAEREDHIARLETQLEANGDVAPADTAKPDTPSDTLDLLNDRITTQQATIERLEGQLSELRQDREMLSGLMRSRAKTKQPTGETLADQAAQVSDLEQKIDLRDKIIRDREKTLKRLLGELEQLAQDKRIQREEISAHIEDLENANQEQAVLADQLNALTGENEALLERHQVLERELQDVKYALEQSESWLSKFKSSAAKRSEELGSIAAERDALKMQLANHEASDGLDETKQESTPDLYD